MARQVAIRLCLAPILLFFAVVLNNAADLGDDRARLALISHRRLLQKAPGKTPGQTVPSAEDAGVQQGGAGSSTDAHDTQTNDLSTDAMAEAGLANPIQRSVSESIEPDSTGNPVRSSPSLPDQSSDHSDSVAAGNPDSKEGGKGKIKDTAAATAAAIAAAAAAKYAEKSAAEASRTEKLAKPTGNQEVKYEFEDLNEDSLEDGGSASAGDSHNHNMKAVKKDQGSGKPQAPGVSPVPSVTTSNSKESGSSSAAVERTIAELDKTIADLPPSERKQQLLKETEQLDALRAAVDSDLRKAEVGNDSTSQGSAPTPAQAPAPGPTPHAIAHPVEAPPPILAAGKASAPSSPVGTGTGTAAGKDGHSLASQLQAPTFGPDSTETNSKKTSAPAPGPAPALGPGPAPGPGPALPPAPQPEPAKHVASGGKAGAAVSPPKAALGASKGHTPESSDGTRSGGNTQANGASSEKLDGKTTVAEKNGGGSPTSAAPTPEQPAQPKDSGSNIVKMPISEKEPPSDPTQSKESLKGSSDPGKSSETIDTSSDQPDKAKATLDRTDSNLNKTEAASKPHHNSGSGKAYMAAPQGFVNMLWSSVSDRVSDMKQSVSKQLPSLDSMGSSIWLVAAVPFILIGVYYTICSGGQNTTSDIPYQKVDSVKDEVAGSASGSEEWQDDFGWDGTDGAPSEGRSSIGGEALGSRQVSEVQLVRGSAPPNIRNQQPASNQQPARPLRGNSWGSSDW